MRILPTFNFTLPFQCIGVDCSVPFNNTYRTFIAHSHPNIKPGDEFYSFFVRQNNTKGFFTKRDHFRKRSPKEKLLGKKLNFLD